MTNPEVVRVYILFVREDGSAGMFNTLMQFPAGKEVRYANMLLQSIRNQSSHHFEIFYMERCTHEELEAELQRKREAS